ncbi:GNAT family N-acetyltransferase [Fimbriimonas ginsengisoli]|uniref:GCN5-related N-acetyltransferase n=1 Tax=Fimbriimonas ginsengisoli Gsoil 348 TaxID=661478 RepID=A0A068NVE4_FIMGI|nr:GNAT family protein [Fimbriimonas ginsengisoli]AIE87493.1 GCN5-related N-acetyltransferase [Fimbriimonas ginsengisoli Gsoil 348]
MAATELAPIVVEPVVLDGRRLRLEPLTPAHAPSLAPHADLALFQYFVRDRPFNADEAGLVAFIKHLAAMPNTVPFAMVVKETGEAVGCSTYMDIRHIHRGLEIGMTWIGRAHQGTFVNPEAKLLMLEHAFESIGCERVQLKCDARNLQSQAAILKLGAVFEGRLRKHFVLPDGFVRDTMMYSIVKSEWPGVKAGLLARL